MLEIELNESLKRRREDLRTKLDSFGSSIDAPSSAEDLAAKKRELKSLEANIDDLKKQDTGKIRTIHARRPLLTRILQLWRRLSST